MTEPATTAQEESMNNVLDAVPCDHPVIAWSAVEPEVKGRNDFDRNR